MNTYRIRRIPPDDDGHWGNPACGPFVDVQAATLRQALAKALPLLEAGDDPDKDSYRYRVSWEVLD